MKMFVILIGFIFSIKSNAAVWKVGPLLSYKLPSQVVSLVNDGDTVQIEGGVYTNDAVKWNKKNLYIVGTGTAANRTILRYTGDIPNGKGIFVFELPGTCDNATVENIVFDGAQISDGDGANGAGIRFQATNLTAKKCLFMNCQNGILEGHGNVSTSNVVLDQCEFYNNGYQLQDDPTHSGYEHHIYISASVDSLWVTNCYFHKPRGQANSIKTRAQRSYLLYNKIDEEATGYGSWEINIAQGGLTVIMGNVIIQGSAGANHGIVGYDAATNPIEELYFVNNTVINKYNGNVNYFSISPSSGINKFKIYNNVFASIQGATTNFIGGNKPASIDTNYNAFFSDYTTVGFSNIPINDFSLSKSAVGLINRGGNAGSTTQAYSLIPTKMYSSFNSALINRSVVSSVIDIGAYEFGTAVIDTTAIPITGYQFLTWPNPASSIVTLTIKGNMQDKVLHYSLYTIAGQQVLQSGPMYYTAPILIPVTHLPAGLYILKIRMLENDHLKKIVILH